MRDQRSTQSHIHLPFSALRLITAALVLSLTITFGGMVKPSQAGPVAQAGNQPDIATGIWPRALGFDGKNLWIANGFDNTVIRIDESTGKRLQVTDKASGKTIDEPAIKVGAMPDAMTWDESHQTMWVANYDDLNLTLVKADGTVVNLDKIPGHPVAITYLSAFMWVVGQKTDTGNDGVWKFNTIDNKLVDNFKVGTLPTAIVGSESAKRLWVANGVDDTISMLDITQKEIGKSAKVFTANIPALPITLTLDSSGLWVGNYEGKVVRLDPLTGTSITLPITFSNYVSADSPGRPVNMAANKGHTWLVSGDGESVIDLNDQTLSPNAGTLAGATKILTKVKDTKFSYAGAVLATDKYVYVADWLNDRVSRFPVPSQAIVMANTPTPTLFVATAAATAAATQTECNLAPQLKPGDTGAVKNDEHTQSVNIHKDAKLSADVIGKIPVGGKFTINDGPKVDAADNNVCFYNVTYNKITGWIVQGGGFEVQPGTPQPKVTPRYFIEPAK